MNDSSTKPISYFTGVFLVLLAGVFWSTVGLGLRNIEQANVWQILVYRSCALAIFLFIVITVRTGFKPFATIRRVGAAGFVGGGGLVVAFAGGIYSVQTTTVANASFLFASAPFITALLGYFVLRESVRFATWIAAAVALMGIVVMVAGGIAFGHMIGNLSALLSALGFAVFAVSLRWGKLEDMLPAVMIGGAMAATVGAVVCGLTDESFELSTRDTWISLGMGVFQLGAGLTVFTIGSRVVPAAELALLSMTEVLLGPFWVWLFLGEEADLYTLIGGAILLCAIAGNALSGLRRKPIPLL
ncbi:MAG: DMT family transporter [Pseudomonadota bacterium]